MLSYVKVAKHFKILTLKLGIRFQKKLLNL